MAEADTQDIAAGDVFRKTLLSRADAYQGTAPLFYGWAIMEAFLAGLRHAREEFDAVSQFAAAQASERERCIAKIENTSVGYSCIPAKIRIIDAIRALSPPPNQEKPE